MRTRLNWIEQTVEEELEETPPRLDAKLEAYEKALSAVEDIARVDEVDELGEWIEDFITEKGIAPKPKWTRKEGARVCRGAGYEISYGSYLVK